MSPSILRAEGLCKAYQNRSHQKVVALDGVSVSLSRGSFLAIVGRSGSGKSTLVRCLAGLQAAEAGHVWFEEVALTALCGEALRRFRQEVQLVQQDAAQSLNPRWDALTLVREPLDILRSDWPLTERERVSRAVLMRVGLRGDLLHRRPSELSGGQRQRLQLARAMSLSPKLLLLDEPLAGLDPTIQADFLALLNRLRLADSLTCVLVTHDIETAWSIASRVAVMDEGRIIAELSPRGEASAEPLHPYATALLQGVSHRNAKVFTSPYIKSESQIP